MRRGDLYLVKKPGSGDPKRQRVFVVVSHQGLLDTTYSTVICAPVYSNYHGLKTQVLVGKDEGLKAESAIRPRAQPAIASPICSRTVKNSSEIE